MQFTFKLVFHLGDSITELAIDEPIGFKEIVLEVWRDTEKHGVFNDTDLAELTFTGNGAKKIIEYMIETGHGILLAIDFVFTITCGVDEDGDDITDTFTSTLDLTNMSSTCGVTCEVTVPVERKSCYKIIQNRMEVPVDVDEGFVMDSDDNATEPPSLGSSRFDITLDARDLYLKDFAETSPEAGAVVDDLRTQPDWFSNTGTDMRAWVFPAWDNQTDAGMGDFVTSSYNELKNGGFLNRPETEGIYAMTPTVIFRQPEGTEIDCAYTDMELELSLQAEVTITSPSGVGAALTLKALSIAPGLDDTDPLNYQVHLSVSVGSLTGPSDTLAINEAHTVAMSDIVEGSRLWVGVFHNVGGSSNVSVIDNFTWQTLEGSFLRIDGMVSCESSTVQVTMIHELMNRVVHIISGDCGMGVKSDLYGRTDSVFFPTAEDGCGSLRVLTNGLKLRRAPINSQFISLQDIWDGLNPVDCIGIGIELNPDDPAQEVVRIEKDFYFYDYLTVSATFHFVAVTTRADVSKIYSTVAIGYDKWETEFSSGLDEFNSRRKWNTSFRNIKNEKSLLSKFITGSYPTELMRRASFAKTGAADNTYDNDTFMICMVRADDAFEVEYNIDGLGTVGVLPSVSTVINGRLTPLRNLARWYHALIIGAIKGPASDTTTYPTPSVLTFASGEGNYKARVVLTAEFDDACSPLDPLGTNETREEDQAYDNFRFFNTKVRDMSAEGYYNVLPLHRPETFSFETPMTYSEYRSIREQPYALIRFRCSENDPSYITELYSPIAGYREGFVLSVKYRLTEGMANVELIAAYNRNY